MKVSAKHISNLLFKKISAVKTVEEKKEVIKHFAHFISQNNKLSKLSQIVKGFERIWNTSLNEVDVTITLPHEQHVSLPETVGGAKIHTRTIIDPAIMAGVKIKVDNVTIDNTLQTKLRALRQK